MNHSRLIYSLASIKVIEEYLKKTLLEEHELLSIIGNVSFIDSKYFVHTHVTLANQDFKTFGGHLFDAQISATGEFKIDLFDYQINRKFSNNIGLNLWCIEDENN